jgi:hypothetical protein
MAEREIGLISGVGKKCRDMQAMMSAGMPEP